ncbi:MAG: DUF5131 family protein [Nanoarchaeota archaeon]|nr:DUF5131 family protein [Nanoarchaeota archaeon]
MIIKEITCKNCMTKSKLTDYVINPYTGCSHGCKYCYADFIKRFQNIPYEWGDFVYVKINCSELLEKELEKNKPGNIWLSSVCDPYLHLEAKYKLTRRILEIISKSKYKNKYSIEILTKSSLVRRDFDVLKNLNVELGCSINTLNEDYSRKIEPFASSPKERIKVLKDAKKHGIKVYGFISPVLPGITDLDELFKELAFCEYVWIEILNIKKSILDKFLPFIKDNYADKIIEFEYMINNYDDYCNKIEKHAKELSEKYCLKIKEVVRHDLK